MSDVMPTCGQCRFFGTDSSPSPDGALTGLCRRHSPGGKGWPGTRISEWCGDWVASDHAGLCSATAPVPSKVESIMDRLQELDERVTAMELSVTAAHMEFRQKDA